MHTHHPLRHTVATVLSLTLVAVLAACSSTTNGHVVAGPAPTTASTTGFPATTSAPDTTSASGTLPKADFVTQMNAVCADVQSQRDALPTPGQGDYAGLVTYIEGVLRLFPVYVARVKILVARSADRAELTQKWVVVEEADYALAEPVLVKLLAAAKARDAAAVRTYTDELDKVPDHTTEIADFMTSYGLTTCATFESN